MRALYIASAYRLLTLFAIAGLRSGAMAYSIRCGRYRGMATVGRVSQVLVLLAAAAR